jgi:hypothetical protein
MAPDLLLHPVFVAHAGRQGRRVVSAFIATAFAQDDAEGARAQWRRIADQLRPKLPKLAAFLDEAETDVLAYMTFPAQHLRVGLRTPNLIRRPLLSAPRQIINKLFAGLLGQRSHLLEVDEHVPDEIMVLNRIAVLRINQWKFVFRNLRLAPGATSPCTRMRRWAGGSTSAAVPSGGTARRSPPRGWSRWSATARTTGPAWCDLSCGTVLRCSYSGQKWPADRTLMAGAPGQSVFQG